MHQPVMLDEVLNYLDLKPGKVVLDATVGPGGHAEEILKRISPAGVLYGLDADESAIRIAAERLKNFDGSFKLINENFRAMDRALAKEDLKCVDAVLMDLGISSDQMEDAKRGFSIKEDGRLDMRMDPKIKTSAYDLVNRLGERELSDIIEKFGEERFHSRIARHIAESRSKRPIETTSQLALIIHRAVGSRYGSRRIDPATRTFQAIRIAVNDELGALEEALKKAVSYLAPGGRICVISFHSLEDRIVKRLFKGYADLGVLKIITKKPLRPSEAEAAANPRSRSAKLRAAERI